jgi:hypothetical protein
MKAILVAMTAIARKDERDPRRDDQSPRREDRAHPSG